MNTIEIKIEKTVEWLRQKQDETRTNGMLVGVSGGVDSAVVAMLIKKALPDNSMGIILPINNSEKDLLDANELIKVSNISSITIDLTSIHSQMMNSVKENMPNYKQEFDRITDANLRARLRMSTLYAVANNLNYLVVGTDNAAEILTGYFTKYGDGGVDILPIAHLLKSEVYEWGKYLGVPQSILNKAPSAGLWEGQTDELEMGTTYKYIDDYLSGKEIPEKDKEIILNLNKKTEHKRNTPSQPPKF